MRRSILVFVVATLVGVGSAFAQEIGAGAGRFEISAFPGGGIFFTEGSNGEPGFGNYSLGAAATVNANKWIGIEGEIGGGVGIRQRLSSSRATLLDQKTPHMLAYNGNIVVNPGGSDRAIVPYLTGGLGGLTLFDTTEVANLGVTSLENFLTGNMGGGLKWYATRHVGIRGDYRLFIVKSNDTASSFFASQDTRYGHRVSAGLLLTY